MLDNLVLTVGIAPAIREQQPFFVGTPCREEICQHFGQRTRQRHRRHTARTLERDEMIVPGRAPHKDHSLLEVQVINRESENFARPEPRHRGESEYRSPRLRRKRKNRAQLLSREKSSRLVRLRARNDKIPLLELRAP